MSSGGQELYSNWHRRASRAIAMHFDAARSFERRADRLGIATLLGSFVAAMLTVIVVLEPDVVELRYAAAFVASLASALALIQSDRGYRSRAEMHRQCAADYALIRRLIESNANDASPSMTPQSPEFARIREQYTEVSKFAPIVPKRVWDKSFENYQPDAGRSRSAESGSSDVLNGLVAASQDTVTAPQNDDGVVARSPHTVSVEQLCGPESAAHADPDGSRAVAAHFVSAEMTCELDAERHAEKTGDAHPPTRGMPATASAPAADAESTARSRAYRVTVSTLRSTVQRLSRRHR